MIVEDKILAYLDGSLGEHESAELLETLAVSPEKRALLEEHLRMKDILALGRKPYSVPLSTERELAERIPILSRRSVELTPVGFRSALRWWAGSRAMRTAVAAAALLAISAGAWFAMRPAQSQSNGISGSSQIAATQLPSVDQQQSVSANLNDRSNVANIVVRHSAGNHFGRSAASKDLNDRNDAHRAERTYGSATNDITNSATMPSEIKTSDATPSSTINDKAIHPITNFSQSDAIIPHQSGASTLSEIESGDIQSRNPITIGVHFAEDNSYLPQAATIAAQSYLAGEPDVTIDYDVSDNFAIGLEAGREIYASLTQQQQNLISAPAYSRINYYSVISATQTNYYCLTTHYTIAPESAYPFRIGLMGGIASTGQPTALATVGISRVLSENLLLDLDAVFGGSWGMTPQSTISLSASGGVEGIVHDDVPQQKTFTSSAGIRAGIRFRL